MTFRGNLLFFRVHKGLICEAVCACSHVTPISVKEFNFDAHFAKINVTCCHFRLNSCRFFSNREGDGEGRG